MIRPIARTLARAFSANGWEWSGMVPSPLEIDETITQLLGTLELSTATQIEVGRLLLRREEDGKYSIHLNYGTL